jgi:hypothetical protein
MVTVVTPVLFKYLAGLHSSREKEAAISFRQIALASRMSAIGMSCHAY